jgi:hypothetical protein
VPALSRARSSPRAAERQQIVIASPIGGIADRVRGGRGGNPLLVRKAELIREL